MNKEFENILEKYGNRIIKNLIALYDEMGIRATGEYAQSLEVQINKTRMTILGAYHSQFMESGRRPGGRPPIPSIMRWLDNKKNLPPSMLRDKRRTAFAIANKIAKEGVSVPSQYNAGEVISKVINEFLAKDIYDMIDELGVIWQKRFSSTIDNILKAA